MASLFALCFHGCKVMSDATLASHASLQADEFKRSRASYEEKAQHYTRKYAMGEPTNGSAARLIGDAADKENLEPNDDDPPPARKLRKLAK